MLHSIGHIPVNSYFEMSASGNKDTKELYEGGSPKAFRAFQNQAERKLQMLDSASTVEFLRSPPGNRLELLTGKRKGQYSIHINQQYRQCFNFKTAMLLMQR